jgi:hypothetical protein
MSNLYGSIGTKRSQHYGAFHMASLHRSGSANAANVTRRSFGQGSQLARNTPSAILRDGGGRDRGGTGSNSQARLMLETGILF